MIFPDLMLDLETKGKLPGSVIASIGAVPFNPYTGHIGGGFYVNVDEASCKAFGLVTDAETEAWWADPARDTARAALAKDPQPLMHALKALDGFWTVTAAERIWCQGPSFDQVILEAAYRAVRWAPPFRYNAGRCTRTIYDLSGIKPDTSVGVYHNALDDALMQAKAVIAGYRKLGLCPAEDSETRDLLADARATAVTYG